MNKEVFQDLSYGVYVISSKEDNRDVGCIANSVMQVTSSPATIAISINLNNYTNKAIKESKEFICTILPVDVDSNVIRTFGFESSQNVDKFENMDTINVDNFPILKNTVGYIHCQVVKTIELGTHTIFIGEVLKAKKLNNKQVMTYDYYHQVKKGKSPKNAPTYIEEIIVDGKKKYRCKVCGYIFEGDELPDDYVCPICGVTREMFEEIS